MRRTTISHALNFSLFIGGPDVIGAQNWRALYLGGTLPSERLVYHEAVQADDHMETPSYAWHLGEERSGRG